MENINELLDMYKLLNDFINYIEKEKAETIKLLEEKGGTISSE